MNAYVGARFIIGSELHYGWIKLLIPSISSNGGIIEEWAYNSIPGEFIVAGQVPEPATVTLLLAGGGFLWWRVRRVQRHN